VGTPLAGSNCVTLLRRRALPSWKPLLENDSQLGVTELGAYWLAARGKVLLTVSSYVAKVLQDIADMETVDSHPNPDFPAGNVTNVSEEVGSTTSGNAVHDPEILAGRNRNGARQNHGSILRRSTVIEIHSGVGTDVTMEPTTEGKVGRVRLESALLSDEKLPEKLARRTVIHDVVIERQSASGSSDTTEVKTNSQGKNPVGLI